MAETVFSGILSGEIPADIVYEDDLAVAFNDINPQAPTHILIIPRRPLTSIAGADEADAKLLGHLLLVAARLARKIGLDETGYRVVTNIGQDGGQTVDHLHLHLLGGRPLGWPPG